MRAPAMMLCAVLLGAATTALAQQATENTVPAPADWGQALREDAQAFHDIIADSHPGPLDTENPGFNALLEGGLTKALQRAETADDYNDWRFAMWEYGQSFDDGHLGISKMQTMGHPWTRSWPGFLTGLRETDGQERHEVVFSQDPAAPPVGAVLVSCDGRAAPDLAAEVVGRTSGRWTLASRRINQAPNLFLDSGNPYVRRAERCDFVIDGQTRTYDLAWRDLPDALREEAVAKARSPRFTTPIELRDWSGGKWIGMGAFDSGPETPRGRELTALLAAIETNADAIRQAPVVVFDLRGNNGGSSSWITRAARILWEDEEVDARMPRSQGVDWRVSAANIAKLEEYRASFANSPTQLRWAETMLAGLTGARDAGQPLWRQAPSTAERPAPPAEPLMKGRVYFFTDGDCASACLDAVDTLLALGATQVGRETSADTVYMEVRSQPLPSGRAEAFVPMKVYRGRPRGNNETVVPRHVWSGALSDTAGIEAWLSEIDARGRR